MRVLLVSHGAAPYGAEQVLVGLARGLADRGHDVVLDFPHAGPAVDLVPPPPEGGPDVRVGARRRLPRSRPETLRYAVSVPATARALRRRIRQVRPEAVWVSSLYNPWAALVARTGRLPVVWHVHEVNRSGPLGLLAAAFVGATADRVVAVSRHAAKSYTRYPWLRSRTEVLHNPLLRPVDPVDPPDPESPFTVGYVGQIEPRKRPGDLAKALALSEDVRGIFIGGGKAVHRLEREIRRAGVGDRVRVLGFQPDIRSHLANLHCLAIPSLGEAFGLVGLEAMAAGLPVIAARSGALPEVLGDAALYHSPADPAELARSIARFRADPKLRKTLRDRGLQRATRFRYTRWIDHAERILSAARASRRGR